MIVMENFIKYEFTKIPQDKLKANSVSFLKKMSSRRTVREFADEKIPEEVIVNLIKTAATAPSGANKQPWFFYLVKSKEIKIKIREAAEKVERENYSKRFTDEMKKDLIRLKTNYQKPFLETSPYLIVVCKERYRIIEGKKYKNYYVNESVGIAIGFLMAAIHSTGLVTVPYTPNPMNFLREILNIPANLTPVIVLPVGYPKSGTKVPSLTKKSVKEIMAVV